MYPLFPGSFERKLGPRWQVELPAAWAIHFRSSSGVIDRECTAARAWRLFRSGESRSFHANAGRRPVALLEVDGSGRFTVPHELRIKETKPGDELLLVVYGMWLAIWPQRVAARQDRIPCPHFV
jgi:hypothetical protein